MVDEANIIKECDDQNNVATAQIVLGGSSSPDLTIISSNVVINAPTIEGQSATISATVNNTGTLGATNAEVSFYDGDPANGGTLIDSVIIASIDAWMNGLAEVSWDTMGQSGINFIHVVIDPLNSIEEANENNNTTLIQVDVQSPSKPDLVISSSDIVLSNQNPTEGDPLTLTATIHNVGNRYR